jgi:glutamate 5-kinase
MTIPPQVRRGRRRAPAAARRVVVKLGTAVLTHEDGSLAEGRFHGFVEALAALRREGRDVVVVTSGAVGVGACALGLPAGPAAPAVRRACAAVGQGRLMARYAEAFARLGVTASQLLVDRADVAVRARAEGLHRTLVTLLSLGVVPVVNENDALAHGETPADTEGSFADNDQLAALVAERIGADLLVLLTDVDGVYTADPRGAEAARLISVLEHDVVPVATPAGSRRGRGGMQSKLGAARHAARHGCTAVIASGLVPDVLPRLCAGEAVGTLVPARRSRAAPGALAPAAELRRRVAI